MIKKSMFIVVLIILAVVVGIYISCDVIIKETAQKYGQEVLGLDVNIINISTSFSQRKISIKGVEIGNPSGFKEKNIFEFGEILVFINLKSVFKPVIEFESIVIDDAVVHYELGEHGNNIAGLQANIKKMSKHSSKDVKLPSKKVIISSFKMNNAKITTITDKYGKKSLTLPNLHLQGIGVSEKGVTLVNASQQVIEALVATVMQVNLSDLIGTFSALKTRFGEAKKDFKKDPQGSSTKLLNDLFGK